MVNDDMVPLLNRMMAWRIDNPHISLQVMHDHFLTDVGVKSKYPDEVVKDIIGIAIGTLVGAILTGSVAFPLIPLATTLALYAVNFVFGFFQQIAWANLRYTYSGRYAMRVYEDLFNFRSNDLLEIDWELFELQDIYRVIQHE
jgi:hypothetical protein